MDKIVFLLKNIKVFFKNKYFFLILILLISTYLRFANYPLKYGFDIDPARDALIIGAGAKHFWFPLVGPKSGIGNFSFGPWYYYELILFKIVFPFTYSSWIFIGITSVLFVLVMYFIGVALEGETFGLILALISAISPEQIGPTTGLSNPNLIPLHMGLAVLVCIYYIKNKNLKNIWIFIWGLIVGIGINIHYEMVLILPLILLAFFYQRSRKAIFDFFIFSFGLILTFIPLIVYNVMHKFIFIKYFLVFAANRGQSNYIPNSWTIYLKDFWLTFLSMLFGVPKIVTLFLIILTFIVFLISIFKKQLKAPLIILLLAFIFDFIFLRYFLSDRQLYYFLFIHPFLFIFLGYTFYYFSKIKYVWILLIIFFISIIPSVITQDFLRIAPRADQIKFRNEAFILENNFNKSKLSIYGCSKSNLFRPYSIVFFLNSDKRLGNNGKVILLLDSNCNESDLTKAEINYTKINKISAVEINRSELNKLPKKLFISITPVSVYNKNIL